MIVLQWIAAIVLFMHLPIPLYWYVLHPQMNFWRRHSQKSAYVTGVALSYFPATVCLLVFRRQIFRADFPPLWQMIAGLGLIVFEIWIFKRVKKDLGGARLVGKTELSGGGEIAEQGIYAHIRHPRYTGSLLAICGACLVAGTRVAWILAAVWVLLTRIAIAFEEREMRARFGAFYKDYARRVPRFFPRIFRNSSGA